MPIFTDKPDLILSKEQLLEIFFSGIKQEQKIGIENEKLLVGKDYNAATYEQVVKVLEGFEGFEPYFENGNLLGLKGTSGNISLEPGSQVEFSSHPFKTLDEINETLKEFLVQLKTSAKKLELGILDIGAQPKTVWNDIRVIPKPRYKCMTDYLPSKGLEPFRMMRETAGVQVNIDYESEEDAIQKLSLALKLSPIVSAMYSNSPLRKGKLTGYKSIRAYSWLNVDEDRCGFISPKLLENNPVFSFKEYMETLLRVPMIFIERGENSIPTDMNFEQFMGNGLYGNFATLKDWETHLSLYFPEIRLKDHIEIRNHDNQNFEMTMTIPALWKGILYSFDAMEEVRGMLKRFSVEDFFELREKTPKYALDYEIKKVWVKDLGKELVSIAKYTLQEHDKHYLEPLENLILQGLTPADVYLKSL